MIDHKQTKHCLINPIILLQHNFYVFKTSMEWQNVIQHVIHLTIKQFYVILKV